MKSLKVVIKPLLNLILRVLIISVIAMFFGGLVVSTWLCALIIMCVAEVMTGYACQSLKVKEERGVRIVQLSVCVLIGLICLLLGELPMYGITVIVACTFIFYSAVLRVVVSVLLRLGYFVDRLVNHMGICFKSVYNAIVHNRKSSMSSVVKLRRTDA